MKLVKVKMIQSVVGKRESYTMGGVYAVTKEKAADLVKAGHAERVGKPKAKAKPVEEKPVETEQAPEAK